MKKFRQITIVLLILLAFGCAKDKDPLMGEWKLTSWFAGIPIDLNNDNILSTNLLKETDCPNKEILTVKRDSTISSVDTFNPIVNVKKTDTIYNLEVECSKGTIGFATSFKKHLYKLHLDSGGEFVFKNDKLVRVFKGAIKVYDSTNVNVIEKHDLVLTYKKE